MGQVMLGAEDAGRERYIAEENGCGVGYGGDDDDGVGWWWLRGRSKQCQCDPASCSHQTWLVKLKYCECVGSTGTSVLHELR